nr:MAG: hypothetical protein 3 [Leviviridae sp.]
MLVQAILHQAALDLDLSVERDVATMRRRCEHEGLSFLTITLPVLSDSLERGLECGLFSCPSSFSRHGRLPRFLGGFFNRVFSKCGELLDDACPIAVSYIRQICRFFKKPKIACSPEKNSAAAQHFIDVEGELRMLTSQVERKDEILDKISALIWSQVFPEIDSADLVCHHGPGVTADKLLANGRHRIRNWHHRSEYLFPSDLHCYPNYEVAARVSGIGNQIECIEGPKFLDLRDEMPVRVVFVPKTQTAPRVIAIEPSHVQYMQQSVKDYVYKVLETHSLTKNSVRFSRQDFNQRLAHSGSIDKRTSTLDLKDASDRVHLHLVQRIFKNSGLLEYLEDARSLHATLPDGRNIVLFKYASMGSALCFPVEAMVFYTLVQCAMHQLDGRRPCSRSIRYYSDKIDIYGDDIIVPVDYTDVVVNYLESYALKVNVSKSFSKGNFRESCGADFFKGYAVNPVYARQIPHDDSRDWTPAHVMSWAATSDLFYMRGQWIVAQAIRDMVTRVVRRRIPRTRVIGSGVAFFSYLFTTDLRWNADWQCWKQKRLVYQPTKKKDDINDDELACLNLWGIRNLEKTNLERYGLGFYSRQYRDSDFGIPGLANKQESPTRNGLDELRCKPVIPYESEASAISRVAETGIQVVPVGLLREEGSFETLLNMEIHGTSVCPLSEKADDGAREWKDPSADYCLTEEIQSDPLLHLFGDINGIDFTSSTKRGSFKSTCRWVSLTS